MVSSISPRLEHFVFRWSLLACSILVDGVQAATYCLEGGQLAGVIFGTILGTVAVLAAVFLVFLHLKGTYAKGCPSKDAQLDVIDNGEVHSSTTSNPNAVNHETSARCTMCGHPRCEREYDEEKRDRHNNRHKAASGHVSTNGEKDKLTSNGLGNDLDKTPHQFAQNYSNDRSDSEYRTKKKRNSVFSSWWVHHTSSKRRISHSTESLNSVNEVVRVLLKSRDVNGLGFNIFGNLRDGIFVKSLSNRGPAKESGSVHEGDRILTVTINFENIVFEDALTIISYASAYPVTLELQRADSATARRHSDNGAEVTPIGSKPFLGSDKGSSASKSSKAVFHPLFKSQSIEDVSSFRSTSPAVYSHIFDGIDSTLEARRAKSLTDSSTLVASLTSATSKPKPVPCSLEVIEETPQLPRRSPAVPRRLLDDSQSLDSTVSSLDTPAAPNGENAKATTITVTAEINAVDNRDEEDAFVINDPYAGLSYEEQLQIIRLSYEDADPSRGTPNPSQEARCDSQMTAVAEDASQKALDDFIKSPSPTLESFLGSAQDPLRRDDTHSADENSFSKGKENGAENLSGVDIHDDEAALTEDDVLSMGESPSSLESSTSCHRALEHQNLFPAHSLLSKHRLDLLTSPGGSSIDTSSTESDRHSSPEHSKRDSGYDGNANGAGSAPEDEVEKAQYEKLLYFQRQLAKQHEELARLGIHIPMPAGTIQQPAKRRPHNGQYTSA